MSKPLVILGTARPDGDTCRAIGIAFPNGSVDLTNLSDRSISGYDYTHGNADDDFLDVVEDMLKAQTIVFATPVYWYAMSAELKVFFDRLSDLLTIAKEKGRKLAGRDVWLIASGSEESLPEGFKIPFKRTAEYLDMRYRGAGYLYAGGDVKKRQSSKASLAEFGQRVLESNLS